MERNITNYSYYKNKVFDYAQNVIDARLQKQGKLIKDITPVYVIYIRKSTKGSKKQEKSLKDQLSACQRVVKENGLKMVRVFEEKESAKRYGKRGVFDEMMDGIRKKHYNSIIAWHPDRLARNMKDAGFIIDMLDRNVIIDLKFPTYIFSKDPNGLMALGIQFVLAKQYSDTLSVTSTRGSKSKALEGKANRAKFGYILNKSYYFRPDKHSYPLLKDAFLMALNRQPLVVIADYLNKNRFEYEKKVMKMTKQKLSVIFRDPFYSGVYIYGDQRIDMSKSDPSFEPMISHLDFIELRNIFENVKGFKKKFASEVLLREMVMCNFCGNFMTPGKPRSSGKSRLRYLRLICTNRKCIRYFDKKSNGKGMPKDMRAKTIFDYIVNLLQKGVKIDKNAYNQYVVEAKKQVLADRFRYVQELKINARQLKDTQIEIDNKTIALSRVTNEKMIKEVNEQIKTQMDEKDKLTSKREELEGVLTNIDHSIESQMVSYENFLNFFKNIVGIIQNQSNRLLIDKVIRMVFLNFTIDYKKVVSHQLNPSFKKYLEVPSVLDGDPGET